MCGCAAAPPVQITNGLSDALLRASAERAVQAVLMAPLTLQDESAADRLSEKVMTGGWNWVAGTRGRGGALGPVLHVDQKGIQHEWAVLHSLGGGPRSVLHSELHTVQPGVVGSQHVQHVCMYVCVGSA